jgi:hypothetical protein
MTENADPTAWKSFDLFGNYKAEWLGERIFELFRTPTYFPDLQRPRPCVLIGGRGTGKTTVLRTLSYEGRFALDNDVSKIPEWPYYGFYYRVNTNRVTAFQGPELPAARWQKLFGHYLNLVLCQQTLKFLTWYESACPESEVLSPLLCLDVSRALHIAESTNLASLRVALNGGLIDFEAALNNIRSESRLSLSLQGAPLDILFSGMRELSQFRDKHFFFLIDEYENLLDDQQVVVNSLLKHASDHYTFKIGVRELGWRRRNTLSDTEELTDPADYVRVDIANRLGPDEFRMFAQQVCDARVGDLLGPGGGTIVDLFPSATADEEAEYLGAETAAMTVRAQLAVAGDARIAREAGLMTDLELLLVQYRARQTNVDLERVMRDRASKPDVWRTFVENYRHAVLFQIADSKSQIRKLYCGWGTFTSLASSNIRYLLELVDHAFREHRRIGGVIGAPFSWETQTLAAQAVGRKNLFELEGFREGALLVKLTIGLGRLFQIMAQDGASHAPEQNQFSLQIAAEVPVDLQVLLTNAVMHSALIRIVSNKLNKTDARSYDYGLHPIFSAFFGISHRKKRKIIIDPAELMLLVTSPTRGVNVLLSQHGRTAPNEPLPEQLLLFGGHLVGPV